MEALQLVPSQNLWRSPRRPEAQLCPFALCWQRSAVALTAPLPYRLPKHFGQSVRSARLRSRGDRAQVSCQASQLQHQLALRLAPTEPLAVLDDPARLQQPLWDLSEGLEAPVQLLYLLTLLGFLVVGAWLVVRQVLVRRDLEEAAKVLGERTRNADASSEDCFELGVILLRKKLFTQAVKNLERARKSWSGLPDELAQVYNALGFAYFNMEKNDLAVEHYRKAVELQPGYVVAWNNLGDAFEKKQRWGDALKAYDEALTYAPTNKG
ncbi:hypothetical protein WJX73_008264 [Symbiochloris irregularis]|uniref:Ycf37 n=1 Tax=Symbiochloris irregularis TaxID=706552 RepID=A0AAW1PIS6_9CHLO